jgi:hypothetical protein
VPLAMGDALYFWQRRLNSLGFLRTYKFPGATKPNTSTVSPLLFKLVAGIFRKVHNNCTWGSILQFIFLKTRSYDWKWVKLKK